MCSAECQSGVYVAAGGQPAHLHAWTNSDTDQLCGGFFRGTIDTLNHAFVRPRHHGWPAFQELLGDTVHACLRQELSVPDAWRRLRAAAELTNL
ncbi:MAG: hypothetical protein LR015_00745 [Verrucomicrobia bacterium]|nr:hypothetical protein [Verrucomicrobiota bacterium]